MDQDSTTKRNRRVYLFTHPRVASNLLLKILNVTEQNVPSSWNGGYFFRELVTTAHQLQLRHKPITIWTENEIATIRDLYQKIFKDMKKWLEDAERKDQIAFIKEHVIFMVDPVSQAKYQLSGCGEHKDTQGLAGKEETEYALPKQWQVGEYSGDDDCPNPSPLNETVLSDEFLLSFTPTFLVRNPACVFPSNLRAHIGQNMPSTTLEASEMVAELKRWMTFRWIRNMYEFYVSKGIEPLVLDADDIIHSPEIVIEYAKHIGLDPNKLTWDWEPTEMKKPETYLEAKSQRFLSTISSSSGVRKDKSAQGLDINVEKKKWKAEFGELIGDQMARWVEDAMEDYIFLKNKRLTMI